MTVSKVLLSAVIALAVVPAAAQAADVAVSNHDAARALSLSTPVRAGAKSGKSNHAVLLALGPLFFVGVVAAAVGVAAAAGAFNGSKSG